MNIGIVGGSLAGCSAAALLVKEGHDVAVFERSSQTLTGRGGGIGTSKEVLAEIKQEGLIDETFSYLTAMQMPFIGKHEKHEPYGRTAWSWPLEIKVFHWNELWQQLRKNVPDACYHAGIEIVQARSTQTGAVEVITSAGKSHQFDLLLFADGYKSLGRRILFPDKSLKYRGYVLWRGLLNESEMNQPIPLKDHMPRLSYQDQPGHTVVYFIPNKKGSKKIGERIFNWAAYIAIPEGELDQLMTDKTGQVRQGTLPPGALTQDNEIKLKSFIWQNIPAFYGQMVQNTRNSYIQVIYTLELDCYYQENMCLIGDAGMVVQPFTGSGIFKGYNNIKDLIACLNNHITKSEALKEWSDQQVKNGKRLLSYGEQLEHAFIWNPINFSSTSEERVAEWFKEAVTPPKNFDFGRDD